MSAKTCRSANTTFYKCNSCNKQEPEYAIKLDIRNLDNNIQCKFCKKYTQIADWKCECNTEWFLCDKHCHPTDDREGYKAIRPATKQQIRRKEAEAPVTRKRKCDPTDYRFLLQENIDLHQKGTEVERAKRPADVIIGDNTARRTAPRLLGPILGKRFAALQPRVNAEL